MTESPDYRDATPGDSPDTPAERREWRTDRALHGERLDKLVVLQAPEFSRNHLQGLIAEGHVQVDGVVCLQASRRIKSGQAISVDLIPTAQALAFRPEAMPLVIFFEDEHVMVIDKPAGLVVHPGAGNWSGTLLNGLLAYHAAASHLPRAGIVHRLDKGTSGLMVVGKTLPAVTELVRAISAREVKREYAALAQGEFSPSERSFEGSIGRDPVSRLRMAVVGSGKPARTDVQRLHVASGTSALLCRLHSGRTHQIRVHLSHAGWPLVSDTLYGGKEGLGLNRPALHAWHLAFHHPILHTALSFRAGFPPDFENAWRSVTSTPSEV